MVCKNRYSTAIQKKGEDGDTPIDHAEVEAYRQAAVDAYKDLLKLVRANDPKKVPEWPISNLSILLFVSPGENNYQHIAIYTHAHTHAAATVRPPITIATTTTATNNYTLHAQVRFFSFVQRKHNLTKSVRAHKSTCSDWAENRMEVWLMIDEVNRMLQPKDIWSANTLFLINVIGAFMFGNDKHFEQVCSTT
jgi:hypothetical protein